MKEELNLLKNQKQLNFKPFLKIGNIYSCLKIFSLILLIFSNPPPVHFLLKKNQKNCHHSEVFKVYFALQDAHFPFLINTT